jgi:Ca2+-binding EF-hand superfamily protein
MRALNCEHSTRDFDRIFDYFDAEHRNQMSGEEFLAAIGLGLGTDTQPSASKRSVHIDIEKLLNFARKKVEDSVGSGSHATKRLKDIFLEMDIDRRSGLVDRRQFTRALTLLKVDLTSREIDTLFDHFDNRGKEAIAYNEFISSLFPSAIIKEDPNASGGRQRYDSDMLSLMDSIRRKLEDYGGSGSQSASRIKEIFAEIDINNSGDIDKVPIIR